MAKKVSVIDRIAGVLIAAALMVIAMLFVVLGVTFLPVIGILVAVPVMGLSLKFLALGSEVREVVLKEKLATVDTEGDPCCPWPALAVQSNTA